MLSSPALLPAFEPHGHGSGGPGPPHTPLQLLLRLCEPLEGGLELHAQGDRVREVLQDGGGSAGEGVPPREEVEIVHFSSNLLLKFADI